MSERIDGPYKGMDILIYWTNGKPEGEGFEERGHILQSQREIDIANAAAAEAVKGERERVNGLAAKASVQRRKFLAIGPSGLELDERTWIVTNGPTGANHVYGEAATFLEALELAATTQPSSPSSSGTGE